MIFAPDTKNVGLDVSTGSMNDDSCFAHLEDVEKEGDVSFSADCSACRLSLEQAQIVKQTWVGQPHSELVEVSSLTSAIEGEVLITPKNDSLVVAGLGLGGRKNNKKSVK